jgi:putative protease
MSPQGNHSLLLQQLWDKHGQPIHRAPGAGHRVQMALPDGINSEFMLIIRDLPPAEPAIAAEAEKENTATTPETAAGSN